MTNAILCGIFRYQSVHFYGIKEAPTLFILVYFISQLAILQLLSHDPC